MRTISKVLLAVFLPVAVAMAADPVNDPIVGHWTLNVQKSTYTPGPAPQSQKRTYSYSPEGLLLATQTTVTADGKETTHSARVNQDGKEHRVNISPTFDTLKVTQLNAHTYEYMEKKAGKVVGSGRRVVSQDGKTLTVNEKGTDAEGVPFEIRAVYERG